MYGMLIQISTSLFCRADGFRSFIFGFLVILVVMMIVGHTSFRAYQRDLTQQPVKGVDVDTNSARELGNLPAGGSPAIQPPRQWLKKVHGVAMLISFSQLAGAGIMFTRRSESLVECKPFYAVDDTFDAVPALIWERQNDGVTEHIMGGFMCELTSGDSSEALNAKYVCRKGVQEDAKASNSIEPKAVAEFN